MANLSKYYFCRNFKKHFGTSPMKFVTLVKINKAKELLKREDLRVKEVASHAGFNNLGTFIRQFKKAEGLTPTSYKELRKKILSKIIFPKFHFYSLSLRQFLNKEEQE